MTSPIQGLDLGLGIRRISWHATEFPNGIVVADDHRLLMAERIVGVPENEIFNICILGHVAEWTDLP